MSVVVDEGQSSRTVFHDNSIFLIMVAGIVWATGVVRSCGFSVG